jgi:excisionase family DNA binding protein
MSSQVMTPEQVAEFLQINPATVYRYIRQHRLEASRLGRHYRITREAVDRFLRTNSNISEVRAALFDRVARIAEHNPNSTDEDVMRVLEEIDTDLAFAR